MFIHLFRRGQHQGRRQNGSDLPNPNCPKIPHLPLLLPTEGCAGRLGVDTGAGVGAGSLRRQTRRSTNLFPLGGPRRNESQRAVRVLKSPSLATVWWPLEIPGVESALLSDTLNSGGVSSRPILVPLSLMFHTAALSASGIAGMTRHTAG